MHEKYHHIKFGTYMEHKIYKQKGIYKLMLMVAMATVPYGIHLDITLKYMILPKFQHFIRLKSDV